MIVAASPAAALLAQGGESSPRGAGGNPDLSPFAVALAAATAEGVAAAPGPAAGGSGAGTAGADRTGGPATPAQAAMDTGLPVLLGAPQLAAGPMADAAPADEAASTPDDTGLDAGQDATVTGALPLAVAAPPAQSLPQVQGEPASTIGVMPIAPGDATTGASASASASEPAPASASSPAPSAAASSVTDSAPVRSSPAATHTTAAAAPTARPDRPDQAILTEAGASIVDVPTATVPTTPAGATGDPTRDPGTEAAAPRMPETASAPAAAAPVLPPPTPASTLPAAAQPVDTPRTVAAQVAPTVFALAQRPEGEHRMTLTVHPDTLGPVTVRAHIGQGGEVRVELLGATDAGREALRTIVADLRRDLATVIPHASLSLGAGSDPGGAGRESAPGQNTSDGGEPSPLPARAEIPSREAESAAPVPVPPASALRGRGLDIVI